MFSFARVHRASALAVIAGPVFAAGAVAYIAAQHPANAAQMPGGEPSARALPIAEDRGEAALEQALKRLNTTASILMIVAHPDDEDGSLLTYLSRGMGVRATLMTLTRGEGGQNVMSGEIDDALGLIRTNELLKADEYYGANQLWGTEVDFGFSKTQEESFSRWGHERVLYDAVLAVRMTRPQVIVSTFLGGITDGHGQHQVSGEIAQEAFKAAGDPKVFPEQLKDGLEPWQPLAVYSMVPFAPVTDGRMFDYATGKWAPAKFKNYVTGESTTSVPSTDVTLPVGTWDLTLGRSYVQIARQGWGEQKSQNGGANPSLSGPATASYHLWGVAPVAAAGAGTHASSESLFDNPRVRIDTSIEGIAQLAKPIAPDWLHAAVGEIGSGLARIESQHQYETGLAVARGLAPLYKQTLDLRDKVAGSDLDPQAKSNLLFELDTKIHQFQDALRLALGLDLVAFTTREKTAQGGGFRGGGADETAPSVVPGEEFRVRVHTAQATKETQLQRVWLESSTGDSWKSEILSGAPEPAAPTSDPIFTVRAATNAEPTAPYFTRPSIEQPFYDLTRPQDRERSFVPYPLSAWAEFTFDGLPIQVGQVVQTLQRATGPGGTYEPLVVTPAIGVSISPEARILPLDGGALPVQVTVHALAAAEGTVELKLPEGWRSEPAQATFKLDAGGDTEPMMFSVTPSGAQAGAYAVEAAVHCGGQTFGSGWHNVSYAGLRPYNQYRTAQLKTRKVDVKLAPGLHIAYVMGPGDLVPGAIEGMGVKPHLLSDAELASADLSAWNVIVIGIRAYSTRPELARDQARLDDFVRSGGTVVVEYQSSTFPAPLPLAIGRFAERVVDEQAPVKLLDPANPLLNWPNRITEADFGGWVEERGHGFLESWDKGYAALTETADPGQDPQRGGLLVAHPGKGTYIYVAYALYRQLPELVPGAYRLLANLLSAGRQPH
jgi:LmbE family N-acetylglucosaminyl deacetylase